MKIARTLALLFLFCSSAYPINNSLVIDLEFSPYMGSYGIDSTRSLLQLVGDKTFHERLSNDQNAAMSLARLSYMVFVISPINDFFDVFQHEYFGHGYRVRTLTNASVLSYHYGTPSPYGTGGGSTAFQFNQQYTLADNALVSIAGIEAESILAHRIKTKWMLTKTINPFEVTLYQASQQALFSYAMNTLYSIKSPTNCLDLVASNDLTAFAGTMQRIYPDSWVGYEKIFGDSCLNLVDPLTFFGVYAWWRYVITGNSWEFPTINIKGVSYLPNLRFSLAPFGYEYGVENYFSFDKEKALMVYVKGGGFSSKNSFGMGFEYLNCIVSNKTKVGLKCDLWYQPDISGTNKVFDYLDKDFKPVVCRGNNIPFPKSLFGLAISAIFEYEVGSKGLAGFAEVGGKSKGYLQGYNYRAYPTLRLGVSGPF